MKLDTTENEFALDGIAYEAHPVTHWCVGCAFKEYDNCRRVPSCQAHRRADEIDVIWKRKLNDG